jgi:dihydroorotate dehydrogenase
MDLYPILRSAMFRLDPEVIHTRVFALLAVAAAHPGALRLLHWTTGVDDPRLRVRAFGLEFPNPFGLGAGFDKDGLAATVWPALGFGHTELGTVTALPQPGNPPPRMFRLPASKAAINRMGFNNAGAEALAERLRRERARAWWPTAPVAVNVGKSRVTPLEDAAPDYEASLRAVWPVADLVVLNVSSPNTPGLRTLQQAGPLSELLALAAALRDELGPMPLLLKVSPDLAPVDLDTIVEQAERHGLDGLVATNTTVRRDVLPSDPNEAGGLSGAPLGPIALEVLRQLRERTRLPLIAVGGIFTAADAIARLEAGASLLQVYTGWIYEGPMMPRKMAAGIRDWLDAAGHATLGDFLAARDTAHDAVSRPVPSA